MKTLKLDMLAEARNAQWSADTFLGPGSIKFAAPAKVNLFLAVGEKRSDGYHDVVNVMHALALHDNVYFQRSAQSFEVPVEEQLPSHIAVVGPAKNILMNVVCADKTQAVAAMLDLPAEQNLVVRAVDALAHAIGYNEPEQMNVHVEKNIPCEAGLGGGSADAAAALLAAAHFWGVAPDGPTLREVAEQLGADVAFFLDGGCALLEGAGERVEMRLQPSKQPIVLVKPDAGVSTAQAYAAFDETPAYAAAELLARVEDATRADEVPLFNNLAPAAERLCPQLSQVREWLQNECGPKVLLCGSGSCTFALCETFAQASAVAARAAARGMWSRATSLSSLKAAMIK